MTADSALAIRAQSSPNHGERRDGARPELLILHYTGMRSGAEALARLCDPRSEVSSHYVVEEDGAILQLVAESRRAWHAGAGSWQGQGDVNSRSIGVEIVNPGHEHGYRPFPPAQVEAVIRLCRDCVDRHSISPQNVLAHADVSPDRKKDPGELFPWDQLSEGGVGHWLPPVPMRGGRFLTQGDAGDPVAAWQQMLARYGYGVETTGAFGVSTRDATVAFQRHFRPERIDGVADVATVETLYRLLRAL